MATYQDIRGKRVKYLSADPSNSAAGEVWYNSTTGTLRSRLATEAWSAGANTINLTNSGGSAQNATQTAGLVFGGRNPSAPAFVSTAEEYNGVGWSAGGALNTARSYVAGFGIQTAAVAAGGRTDAPGTVTAATEEYDGSTWTTNPSPSGDMGSARKMQNGGAGILTAGLGIGPSATEEYGGTTWTAGGALNTTRTYLAGFGIQTAAAAAGGHTPPGAYSDAVEEYNGTSWTSVTSIPAVRQAAGCAGIQTDGLIFGGQLPADTNTTFGYDGSTWSAKPNMANAGYAGTGQGTGAAALAANFYSTPGGITRNTEEFNRSANVITAATWASGGNMNQTRRGIASATAGTQTAALGAMGYTSPPGGVGRSDAETYDGSTWTAITALPSTRYFGGGFGTQGAAVIVGGYSTVPSAGQKDDTYEWDGSSWSQTGNQATGISNFACPGVGIESAGMIAGGMPSPTNWQLTQEYDGSVWATSPGSLNTGRTSGGGAGTQTAAISTGGDIGPTFTLSSEEYNGATWTATSNSLYNWYGIGGAGTTTAALMYSQGPSAPAQSQGWDGSAWSTSPALNTARQQIGGAGTATAAVGFSGNVTPGSTTTTNATEEFTGETSAVNIETLTTS
jgi:hypothetical protein